MIGVSLFAAFAGSLCYDAVGAAGNAAGVPLDGFISTKQSISGSAASSRVSLMRASTIIAAVKVCVHLSFVLGGIRDSMFPCHPEWAPCAESRTACRRALPPDRCVYEAPAYCGRCVAFEPWLFRMFSTAIMAALAPCVGAVGILSAQNDQPGRLLVRYIQRGSGADVQTCKRFLPAQLFSAGTDLLDHIGGYLRCAVLRSLRRVGRVSNQ